MQSFLSPEVLLHLNITALAANERVNIIPGIILITDTNEVMLAKAGIIAEWLDSTGDPSGVGETLTLVRRVIPTRIKSHDGRRKAERLLDQLQQMLS
jgi:hypothetical protein